MRRSLLSVAALSLGLSGIASGVETVQESAPPPPPKPKKPKRALPPILRMATPVARGSIAQGNRRGGEHQHSREIERRLRQEARRKDAGG